MDHADQESLVLFGNEAGRCIHQSPGRQGQQANVDDQDDGDHADQPGRQAAILVRQPVEGLVEFATAHADVPDDRTPQTGLAMMGILLVRLEQQGRHGG